MRKRKRKKRRDQKRSRERLEVLKNMKREHDIRKTKSKTQRLEGIIEEVGPEQLLTGRGRGRHCRL